MKKSLANLLVTKANGLADFSLAKHHSLTNFTAIRYTIYVCSGQCLYDKIVLL